MGLFDRKLIKGTLGSDRIEGAFFISGFMSNLLKLGELLKDKKLKTFAILCRAVLIGLSSSFVFIASNALAKDNMIIAEELLSESELPRAVKKAWSGTIDMCTEFDGDLIKSFGGTEIAIGQLDEYRKTVRFYLLPCGSPAAYNTSQIGIFYHPEEKIAQVASYPQISEKGPTTVDVILNASWEAESGQLTALYKGRGLGDCGTSLIWEWNKTSFESAFVLVEQRSKDNCDGVYDEWPKVWPIQ